MTRKPKAFVAALPLSSLPELREFLAPLLGNGGRRGTVVMMRLGEQNVRKLDDLVEAGLFGSRSEAAAFLVGAGIQAQAALFDRIAGHSAQIRKVRQALHRTAIDALRASARSAKPVARRTRAKSSSRG